MSPRPLSTRQMIESKLESYLHGADNITSIVRLSRDFASQDELIDAIRRYNPDSLRKFLRQGRRASSLSFDELREAYEEAIDCFAGRNQKQRSIYWGSGRLRLMGQGAC